MATNFKSDSVSVIVKLAPTASPSEITNLQAAMGVTEVTTAPQFGIGIWQIPSGTVDPIILAYANDPRVQYMERDSIITLPHVKTTSRTQENLATITPQTTTPNDPGYPLLWGLNNTGQTGGKPDADIDAPEAWDIQTGNQNTVIGVIDSGVDYTHPDLVENIWTNPGETAGDGIDNDNNGYIDDVRGWDFAYNDNDPMDVDGHGTHVSGTIAAKGNNSVGVIGVAWKAQIMPLKFLDDSGSGSISNAILALNYATAKGVKLTNNSWAGGLYSQALYDAIKTAEEKGALFIAAAGNSSQNTDIRPTYPASYNLPNIISVASTTHNDGLSSFSNYGRTTVDLGAPGSEIYSTTPGGNYDTYSGTSMASPHVTGAAALVWSQNPSWTAQQVKNRLLETTDPLAALRFKTVSKGRLNIHKALGGSTSTDNSNLRQMQLPIAPTPPGSAGADNLTETANADTINGLPDTIPGNAKNTLNGGADEDPLTGGPGADTLILPFAQSSVSPKDSLTDFGSETIDLVPQGGTAINAPSLFTVPTLEKGAIPVFTEANGALAGNQALEINSDLLRVAKAGWMADIYPGIYDAKQRGI